MKNHLLKYIVIVWAIASTFCSCEKQNKWLDIKNNKSSVVPETLADFQALLDNSTMFNRSYSTIGLVGADNIYLTDQGYKGLKETERNAYIWNKEIWDGGVSGDWNLYYTSIEHANIVLNGLEKIDGSPQEYDNVKGQALFHRAISFYNLAQLFCKQYDAQMASTDLGLPLRLSADVNAIYKRSTLQQLYDQMLKDASTAAELLAESQPDFRRPIKVAANALLAKIYLVMEDYESAGYYATEAMTPDYKLLDFNDTEIVSLDKTYRFPARGVGNPEILFYAEGGNYASVFVYSGSKGSVDTELYNSYEPDDLRKTFFFDASKEEVKFQGTYTGAGYNFCGIALNEVYLIRAESYARTGNKDLALKDLNALLVKRFNNEAFVPVTANTADDALSIILQERRKELPHVANLRWEDLRRLNKDERFKKTLTRMIEGIKYTLPPNDPRYVLPIPDQEIQLSDIHQNQR